MEDCLSIKKNGVICREIMDLKIIRVSSLRQSQGAGYHRETVIMSLLACICESNKKEEGKQRDVKI